MSMFALRTRSLTYTRVRFAAWRPHTTHTELPRPPPTEESSHVQTFSAPSKPRPYYARPPQQHSELPHIQKRWPYILALAAFGVSGWAAFLLVAMNQERLSSSVVKQILQTVRENGDLKNALGDALRFEPIWYLNGDPWISGSINLPQGNVDLSFRLKGHRGSGTVYFTSIRKTKGEPFTPLRFRVICDDGKVINVLPQPS